MKVVSDGKANEVRVFTDEEGKDMDYPTLYIYQDDNGTFIIELDGKVEMVAKNGRFCTYNLGGDRLEIETYE